jgi:hypothetical protein
MIQLRREDNMSVFILLDESGLAELTAAMNRHERVEPNNVNVIFDRSILTLKKKSPSIRAELSINSGDFTRISQVGKNICLFITSEDRECIATRLMRCRMEGAFIPAELIRLQIPKNKYLDYLYGEYKAS